MNPGIVNIVEVGIRRNADISKISNAMSNAGYSASDIAAAESYYKEAKKKSLSIARSQSQSQQQEAGASPSTLGRTPSSSALGPVKVEEEEVRIPLRPKTPQFNPFEEQQEKAKVDFERGDAAESFMEAIVANSKANTPQSNKALRDSYSAYRQYRPELPVDSSGDFSSLQKVLEQDIANNTQETLASATQKARQKDIDKTEDGDERNFIERSFPGRLLEGALGGIALTGNFVLKYLGDFAKSITGEEYPEFDNFINESRANSLAAVRQFSSYLKDGIINNGLAPVEDLYSVDEKGEIQEKGIWDNVKDGNLGSALALTGVGIVENIAPLAITYLLRNPSAGAAVRSALITRGVAPSIAKYAGNVTTLSPGVYTTSLGNAWGSVADDPDFTDAEKFVYALASPAIETLTEGFDVGEYNAIDSLYKYLTKGGTQSAKQSFTPILKDIGGGVFDFLKAGGIGGLEEYAAGGLQQAMARMLADKPFDHDELMDAFFIGAGMEGGINLLSKSPNFIGRIGNLTQTIKITDEIAKIEDALTDPSISDAERAILTNRAIAAKDEVRRAKDNAAIFFGQYTPEDLQETMTLNADIVRQVQSMPTFKTDEAKSAAIQSVKDSVARLQQIETKYDSQKKQQVPGAVQAGAQPGGVPVEAQGTAAAAPGGVLQDVGQTQQEQVAQQRTENANAFNVRPRLKKIRVTSQNAPGAYRMIMDSLSNYTDEFLAQNNTSREAVERGVKSLFDVISSLGTKGRSVEVDVMGSIQEANKMFDFKVSEQDGKYNVSSKISGYDRQFDSKEAADRYVNSVMYRGVNMMADGKNVKINVLLPAMLDNTGYHEALHSLEVLDDKSASRLVKSLLGALKKTPRVNDRIMRFLGTYDKDADDALTNSEFLAELGSMISSGEISLEIGDSALKNLIDGFSNFFKNLFGLNKADTPPTAEQLASTLKSIAEKLGRGEAQQEYVLESAERIREGATDARFQEAETPQPKFQAPALSSVEAQKFTLQNDGTGIQLNGDESLSKGGNAPTVATDKGGFFEDYTLDEILSKKHAPNSRVVTLASNLALGTISYTKGGKRVSFEIPYENKESQEAQEAQETIESLRAKYKGIQGTGEEAQREKGKVSDQINELAKKVISEFTDMMSQNLLALYDTLDDKFIQNSKEWYVGANRMANSLAKKYNISLEQSGAIIAALSPQNDWFNNVSIAERTIDIMTNYSSLKLNDELVARAVEYNTDKRKQKPNDFAKVLIKLYNELGSVSIDDIKNPKDVEQRAVILRAIDHYINSPKVAATNPDGQFIGFDKTPVRWKSNSQISNAIEIFRNGSLSNINENLGFGNKVRNFYNNIVDPNSETPYLTADTHALSAAVNAPISAEDAGGIGLFNGGMEPFYAMVKQAYIDAAEVIGILPREMQSITWEAQRTGINDKNRQKDTKEATFKYIADERQNEQTPYERATILISRNRSKNPEWGKQRGIVTQRENSEILREIELRANERISSLDDIRRRPKRRLGDADTGMGREPSRGGASARKVEDLLGGKPKFQAVETITLNNGKKIKPTIIEGNTIFYHGSSKKREGRLRPNNAIQWGKAVYFSPSKQDVVYEFGDKNITEVRLNLSKPVYTNTQDFYKVASKAIEIYTEDQRKKGSEVESYGLDDIEDGYYFGEAASQLGYDAIIDINPNNYGIEIAVINEGAIIYPEDIKSISQPKFQAPELSSVEATTKALEGVDINEVEQKVLPNVADVYKIQDKYAERILERSFKPNRVWAYKIENAGDIIRELSKYKNTFLDPGYIYEKVGKLEKFLKDQKDQFRVAAEDSYFQFKRQNSKNVEDFIRAYEELPTISEAQFVAKKMTLDLLNGNLEEAQKGIDYFNEIRKSRDIRTELQKRNKYQISEAYHKAKKDGSNPELVRAVEELLGGKPKVKPMSIEGTPKERRNKFFDEMEGMYRTFPFQSGFIISETPNKGTPLKDIKILGRLSVYEGSNDGSLYIEEVQSQNFGERTGNGSKIMQIVSDMADKYGLTIELVASPIYGDRTTGAGRAVAKALSTPEKLAKFYEKFGFINVADNFGQEEYSKITKELKNAGFSTVDPSKSSSKQLLMVRPRVSQQQQAPEVKPKFQAPALADAVKRNNGNPLTKAPNGKPSILFKEYRDLGYNDADAELLVSQVYTDEFINWFGDWINSPKNASKVVDKNGMPLLVYHGTFTDKKTSEWYAFDLEGSRSFDVGFHFGTKAAAQDRIDDITMNETDPNYAFLSRGRDVSQPRMLNLFLDIKNPLRLTEFDRMPSWRGIEILNKIFDGIAEGSVDNSIVEAFGKDLDAHYDDDLKVRYDRYDEGELSEEAESYPDWANPSVQNRWIESYLKSKGVDGIVYSNTVEDKGKDSFIAFNPTQIKSATENIGAFETTNQDIRFQAPTNNELDKAYERSNKMLKEMNKKGVINRVITALADRQAPLKKAIMKAGLKDARNLLVTQAGAGSRAAVFVAERFKDIYNGLNQQQIEYLDKIILARRIIQIDTDYDNKGKSRIKHPENIDKEIAERNLNEYQQALGANFNTLMQRSDAYFDAYKELLGMMRSGGLITQETYDNLSDLLYQPRLFLQQIIKFDEGSGVIDLQDLGLNAAQIKSLSTGSNEEILTNSMMILAISSKSVYSRLARNKTYATLSEAAKDPNNSSWIQEAQRIGPKSFSQPPRGFEPVSYYVDGVRNQFYLREDFRSQLYDATRHLMSPNLAKTVRMMTGSAVLKSFATQVNPLFALKNFPRDVLHVAMFTNVYGSNLYPALFRISRDAFRGMQDKMSKSADFREWLDYGGGMDFLSTEGFESRTFQTSAFSKLKNALSTFGEYSEVGVRLAVYKKTRDDLVNKYKKDNGGATPSGAELESIKTEAAAASREIIDFAQGGSWAKAGENIVPYLNASIQGSRVAGSYIYRNPAQFAAKFTQLAIGVGIIMFYNSLMGDDEDWEKIQDGEKMRNFIIFLPTKDKDGNRQYLKIAKTQQAVLFTTLAEMGASKMLNETLNPEGDRAVAKKYQIYGDKTFETTKEAVVSFLPKDPTSLSDLTSAVPLFNAALAVQDYDSFFNKKVSRDYNKVEIPYEDVRDEDVPYFYKALSQSIVPMVGAKRLQVATEKITTGAETSVIIAGAYALLDKVASNLVDVKTSEYNLGEVKSVDDQRIKSITSIFSPLKGVIKSVNPNIQKYANEDAIKDIMLKDRANAEDIKDATQGYAERYYEANNKISDENPATVISDYRTFIKDLSGKEGIEPTEIKYSESVFRASAKTAPKELFKSGYYEIGTSKSPQAAAEIIALTAGENLTDAELRDYFREYLRTTGSRIPRSDYVFKAYQREYQNAKK